MYLKIQIGGWELRCRLTRDPALIAQDDEPTAAPEATDPRHLPVDLDTLAETAPEHHEPEMHADRRHRVDDDEGDRLAHRIRAASTLRHQVPAAMATTSRGWQSRKAGF